MFKLFAIGDSRTIDELLGRQSVNANSERPAADLRARLRVFYDEQRYDTASDLQGYAAMFYASIFTSHSFYSDLS